MFSWQLQQGHNLKCLLQAFGFRKPNLKFPAFVLHKVLFRTESDTWGCNLIHSNGVGISLQSIVVDVMTMASEFIRSKNLVFSLFIWLSIYLFFLYLFGYQYTCFSFIYLVINIPVFFFIYLVINIPVSSLFIWLSIYLFFLYLFGYQYTCFSFIYLVINIPVFSLFIYQ